MVQNPCGRTITAARWESCSGSASSGFATPCDIRGKRRGFASNARTGWLAGIGKIMGADAREIADAEVVVIWGGNPVNTQINIMTHTTRARKANAAKLVVIDPYRTGTAAAADMHLALRPGTDGALACAVMHVLFAEGLADQAYLEKYTDCPDAFRRHLETRTPAWAAAITGLSVDEIVAFARLYGSTKKSFIKCGYGFSRSRNGSVNFHAVTCLPAVTGAWTVKGGGASWHSSDIYHWDRTLLEGLDVKDPSVRMLQQSRIGPILNGDPADIKDGPPVTAMLIQNINPCAIAPDTNAVMRGFAREDLFVCVHEQFMTDTAKMADVVLPATTFLEHDDLYQAGGHTHIQIGARLIEPLEESRLNHSVICALGKRLGSQHPGFAMTEWQMIDSILTTSGWPDADTLLAKRWHDCAPSFEEAHFLTGFNFPDGKFRFKPDWKSLGPDSDRVPPMPDHFDVIDEASENLPFRLVTAPARTYLNTTFTETPGSRKREGRPTVMIHKNDANGLDIADGELVRVGNDRGAITLHASVVAGINLGTVIIESVWPNDAFPEGVGINALDQRGAGLSQRRRGVSRHRGLDPQGGIALTWPQQGSQIGFHSGFRCDLQPRLDAPEMAFHELRGTGRIARDDEFHQRGMIVDGLVGGAAASYSVEIRAARVRS